MGSRRLRKLLRDSSFAPAGPGRRAASPLKGVAVPLDASPKSALMFNAGPSESLWAWGLFLTLSAGACLPLAQAREAALEEIVVTAQKREQNIQDVPLSISRLAGQKLAARFTGGEDALALANAAPGLYVETSSGRLAPRFYLRGLGNPDFTQAASQPVSIVFDEVVMERAALKSFPLFDLDDIEIIRGPQGALFGRNTTAGIIKFDSRRPSAETEGHIKTSGGNKGTFNVEAALGGPLIDNRLAGRISFLTQNRAGWIDNAYSGEDGALGGFNIFAGRLQLLWTPTESFSALLLHQRQDQDGNTASAFRANVFTQGSNKLNENYARDRVWFDGGGGNPSLIKSHGSTLKLDWTLGKHLLTSITSYQDVYDRFARADIDGGYGCSLSAIGLCPAGPAGPPSVPFRAETSPFVVPVDTGSDLVTNQLTQEARIANKTEGRFNYQVGAFYFKDEFKTTALNAAETNTVTPRGIGARSNTHIDNRAWAVFGQSTLKVNNALTLTAGARYTDDKKKARHFAPPGSSRFDFIQTLTPLSLGDDHLGWELALAYGLDDASQAYVRVASGFRAPTIQDRIDEDPEVTTADSETILSYEIGYKALWSKVRLNAAAFYYAVDNMQLTAIGGANNSVRLLNAEQGVGYGVEFDLDYAALDNLILSGGFGYNKTRINDAGLATAPCGSGLCTVLDPLDANGFAVIDGNPFQHAPLWTLNVELDYAHPLSGASELYLYTDWKLRGKTNEFLYESVEYSFGTQFEGGLRVGYRNSVKGYEIGLFARNLTDEHNPIGGIDFANNLGYVNQPRIWGAEASYRF